MKSTIASLLLMTALMLISPFARADGFVRGQLGYALSTESSGGNESKSTRQVIDFAGGYIAQARWALLAQYATETVKDTSGGSTVTGNRTSYGVGGGYISGGSVGGYITGTYYLSSEYDRGGTNYKGSGYQVDLGLKVEISRIFLTAGLSYAGFTYKETQSGTLPDPLKQTHLVPRVGLQFEF
jgi:hypothetical protein